MSALPSFLSNIISPILFNDVLIYFFFVILLQHRKKRGIWMIIDLILWLVISTFVPDIPFYLFHNTINHFCRKYFFKCFFDHSRRKSCYRTKHFYITFKNQRIPKLWDYWNIKWLKCYRCKNRRIKVWYKILHYRITNT